MPEARRGLVVLGLDPGSRCAGYGLVHEESGRLSLVAAGTIRMSEPDMAVRMGRIFQELAAIIKEYAPTEAAMENVFVGANVSSALKLGQARGAALAACAVGGLSVAAYEPTVVKKSLVGVGRAEKSQVAFMVNQALQCKKKFATDASDALAVAICHLNQRRFRRLSGLA